MWETRNNATELKGVRSGKAQLLTMLARYCRTLLLVRRLLQLPARNPPVKIGTLLPGNGLLGVP